MPITSGRYRERWIAVALSVALGVAAVEGVSRAEPASRAPSTTMPSQDVRFETVEDAAAFVEEWGRGLKRENVAEWVDLFSRSVPGVSAKSSKGAGAYMKRAFDAYEKAAGTYDGFERLTIERTGESVAVLTFLIRFELTAIPMRVTIYRGPKGWNVVQYNFLTDGLSALFNMPKPADPAKKQGEESSEKRD